ncbi:5-methylaminomethyl-2-thiouridine methyltransferase [Pseudohoeflea suaedae]|uniref:5-methylaminomethyl-2-thiouridine methyltransferase n=1 Tax=Pseudohoeflea suaedae TaxID=877384 RepID=A0A4R5PNV8_9HYPH|nr:tRNA (5-methylaminomethyl-2-thiouridine)(34)-methyltransferase MnmD [Pseudohoeflea suaedae]TDH38598.1 5-methylaminomethyl-2-thiouridine methyltransferase [Pseudohoeflea suaedae]
MSENSGKKDGAAPFGIEWHEGDMPYSPLFGDHFYSRADGRQECAHVFIAGNRLPDRWPDTSEFTIGETGFGTGLNFVETWRHWKLLDAPASLRFVSFERYPMTRTDITRALSVWPEVAGEADALARAWPETGPEADITLVFGTVSLTICVGAAEDRIADWTGLADAWYLDGFAPSRNPDMWSAELMAEIARHTQPGGTFATYTSAGWVRRNLAAAGFIVTKQPGFSGKREMCAGRLG